MKPDGAKELAVNSDLTVYAAESALELMGIDCRGYSWNEEGYKGYGIVVITVPSQQVSQAFLIKDRIWCPKEVAVYVDISFNYTPDEWSISLQTYGENAVSKIVWSSGA